MNQFDLLKSHINAYTRKNGTAVKAHETLASQAHNTAAKASRFSHDTHKSERHGTPASISHEDAATLNKQAAHAHHATANSAKALGMHDDANQHLELANHYLGISSSHTNMHKNSPNGVPSRYS